MSDPSSSPFSTSVFAQIERALSATPQGRAFLRECSRRARADETSLLLDAVARLERRAQDDRDDVDREQLGSLIGQVETALREAKLAFRGSIAPPREPRLSVAPPDVSAFGRETTNAIMAAVEVIQEAAWKIREAGIDVGLCDLLDDQTSAIHAACRRQDRLLDGLSTIERAIGRADAFVGELRRSVDPSAPVIPTRLVAGAPTTLVDEEIEFVPRDAGGSDEPG